MSNAIAEKTTHQLSIDFPQRGEVVMSPEYTLRIEAPGAQRVEVSIDGGEWQPCRHAVGYWWFDWSDYLPGPHQVRAQSVGHDGEVAYIESRRVAVRLDEERDYADARRR